MERGGVVCQSQRSTRHLHLTGMRRKRNRPSASVTGGAHAQGAQRPIVPETPAAVRPQRREWVIRLVLVLAGPLVCLGLLEGGLRVFGFGYPTSFFVPQPERETFTANWKYAWQYYPKATATKPFPFLMPAEKAPGTLRIFVLGESAAAGTPDPAFGFVRILEVMLRLQYPDRRFEVINAAMRGINSHIIRRIADECGDYEPDAFVVYMGNNEAVGLYGPEPGQRNGARFPMFLRLREWVKTTRLSQWMESTWHRFQRTVPIRRQQDMEFFRSRRLAVSDPARAPIYLHFQRNLAAICRIGERAGAKVILGTVASNLRDFPPLASLHRPGLSESDRVRWEDAVNRGEAAEAKREYAAALELYTAAARVDSWHADLAYRLGRCYAAVGQKEKAREQYTFARNLDAMPLRTDTRLNGAIRQRAEARRATGVQLVDIEGTLAASGWARDGVPGSELFLDHVHFTFAGDYLVARALAQAVAGVLRLGTPSVPEVSRQECADALGFTPWDDVNVASAMVRMTAQAPFLDQMDHTVRQRQAEQTVSQRVNRFVPEDITRAIATYRLAINRRPSDWILHYNLGNLLSEMGEQRAAATEFETALGWVPEFLTLRLKLANAFWEVGKTGLARHHVELAYRMDPDSLMVKEARTRLGLR